MRDLKYIIQYQYGSYSGTRVVWATDGDTAIAKIWRLLSRDMTLPMAYQSAKIIEISAE